MHEVERGTDVLEHNLDVLQAGGRRWWRQEASCTIFGKDLVWHMLPVTDLQWHSLHPATSNNRYKTKYNSTARGVVPIADRISTVVPTSVRMICWPVMVPLLTNKLSLISVVFCESISWLTARDPVWPLTYDLSPVRDVPPSTQPSESHLSVSHAACQKSLTCILLVQHVT